MKRLLFALLAFALLCAPVHAQEPIHLPIVLKDYNPCLEYEMSDWKIIIPEATTNMPLNPSAETTGNFAAVGGGTMTRSSTYSRYGLYSYRIQTAANNEGGSLTLSALANAIHYATLRVRGTLPASWDWSVDDATYTAPTLIETIDSNWTLYGLQFPAVQCNGSTTFYIRQNGAGSGDFYIDGVQIEELEYWTTYADGDQQGCAWNGAEHASTSTRSATSRAGGRVRDIQTDYSFDIGGMFGLGTIPLSVIMDEYALLPGGELNAIKVHPRPFSLTGVVRGTSYVDLHSKLGALEAAIAHDTYPQDENGWQPVRLRYTGATVQKEIAAHYEGGLEGNIEATTPCYWQRAPIRFLADDPYLYPPGGSGVGGAGEAALLDTNDSATFRIASARLRSTGQWDDLGPPNVAGVYGSVLAIAEDATYVYLGGDFQNFDNIANADYIVRYNKQTGTFSAMAGGLNNLVESFAIAPNGDLYIGGQFTNAGGDPNADNLIRWDGAAYNAVGVPVAGAAAITTVYSLVFDAIGDLYIGGLFLNWANIANADNIVMWDGAAYNALSTGANARVESIAISGDGTMFMGGLFTSIGGVAANYIASWDGTSFSALRTGMNATVFSVVIDASDIVYIGGLFTTADGDTVNYVCSWNGTSFSTLGSGMNGRVLDLDIGPDGMLYAGGEFTTAGGITVTDRMARWNGASWAHLDMNPPGTPLVYVIMTGDSDPVVTPNYDVWIGFNTSGTANFAGIVTVTNDGTSSAYPIFHFVRSGGTSATLETIRNETTGKLLLFNYGLLDGETLTIDLRPTRKSIVSSMFGSRPDAILANSDFGDFTLRPGDNDITSYVNVAGGPTITAWVEWRTAYKSLGD